MRLSDLDAQLYRHAIKPADVWHGRPMIVPPIPVLAHLPLMQLRYTQWGDFPTSVFIPVASVAEADRIMFECPIETCGHQIAVDFLGRGTPDSACMRNSENNPVRWSFSGTSLEDLTLSPSIALIGGCAWHGFVEAGATRTC